MSTGKPARIKMVDSQGRYLGHYGGPDDQGGHSWAGNVQSAHLFPTREAAEALLPELQDKHALARPAYRLIVEDVD